MGCLASATECVDDMYRLCKGVQAMREDVVNSKQKSQWLLDYMIQHESSKLSKKRRANFRVPNTGLCTTPTLTPYSAQCSALSAQCSALSALPSVLSALPSVLSAQCSVLCPQC